MRLLVVGVERTPETFIANLLRGLGARHDVRVVHRLGHQWARRLRSRAGSTLRITPPDTADPVARALLECRRWRPDVIYFPWNSAAIAGSALYDLGVPVVVSCRGSQVGIAPWDPARAEMADALSLSLGRAARVHCVSDDLARQVEVLGVPPSVIDVVRPAVDPMRFRPPTAARSSAPGVLRVVGTGSLIWRKGFEDLIVAVSLARAAGHDLTVTIVGEGPERDRLRLAALDLGVADAVTLAGRRAPEEVGRILSEADAFALPSVFEGISNAALEAMACGLPTVAADVGGMAEAITDGQDGLLVPPRDPSALAVALGRLAAEPDLRTRLGAAGRRRIEADFAIDAQVAAYEELFERARGGVGASGGAR